MSKALRKSIAERPECQQLEDFELAVRRSITDAIAASAIKNFIDYQYYGTSEVDRKDLFAIAPYFHHAYHANDALLHKSVVDIYEIYKAHDRKQKLNLPVRDDVDELMKHRTVRAHAGSIWFNDPEITKFFTEGKHHKDPVAARLWRIRQSVHDRLIQLNSTCLVGHPNDYFLNHGMVDLIYVVLKGSFWPQKVILDSSELKKSIVASFENYFKSISGRQDT